MTGHRPAGAPSRVLVVTAVPAERDAVLAALRPADRTGPPALAELPGGGVLHTVPAGPGPRTDVLAAGVGPAAAAAGTAGALTAAALAPGPDGTAEPYGLVICAGIGGGFPGVAPPLRAVVASRIVAADLGAALPGGGFAPVAELGLGTGEHRPPAALDPAVAEAAGAVHAPVLTVSTATGTAGRAAELAARFEGAAAEAMEGFGVAEAAAGHGVPVLEVRTVSNEVGPRDRAAWRIPEALTALTGAFGRIRPVHENWSTW
ncbi:futalosine hydrolase [Streptomyces sodiiphilus]|uniref:Futalosine hydrolase n=1 Tax=Streptomyces sodiiphilus TaxID=226217 RepID=A0ABN2NS07_9ACTN